VRLHHLQRLRRSGATAAAPWLRAAREIVIGARRRNRGGLCFHELEILRLGARGRCLVAAPLRTVRGFALDLIVLAHDMERSGCDRGNRALGLRRRGLDVFGLGGRGDGFVARRFRFG